MTTYRNAATSATLACVEWETETSQQEGMYFDALEQADAFAKAIKDWRIGPVSSFGSATTGGIALRKNRQELSFCAI